MNKDLTVALYQKINEADQPRAIDHWHASSIAKCPRALFYERKGIKPLLLNEPGAGKKFRWRSGHAIEATIRPELEKIYPNLLVNVRFTNKQLDLTGEFDGYDPDSKSLISVKSVHDFAMITKANVIGLKEDTGKKNERGNIIWKLKEQPYIHHEWQEHAYVLLMTDEVKYITYVYITLGGLIACYTTPVKPEIFERVKKKVEYLNECWKTDKLPICVCEEGQEMYNVTDQYCPYKTNNDCCEESLYEPNTKTT